MGRGGYTGSIHAWEGEEDSYGREQASARCKSISMTQNYVGTQPFRCDFIDFIMSLLSRTRSLPPRRGAAMFEVD